MNAGLPGIAAAALLGNLTAQALHALPPAGATVGLVLLLPLAVRFARTRWLAVAVVAFVWTVGAARIELERRWPTGAGQRDVAISGYIDDFPTVAPDRAVFSLRVAGGDRALPRRLRLSWYDPPPGLEAGAELEIVARLRSPRGLANPGGFDYERWLFLESLGATGYVREGQVVAGPARDLAQAWLRMRAVLAARITAAADSAAGGALLVALTLGERHAFADQHWVDLRRTGTSHLVAISGLHVGLIATLVFALVRALCLRTPGAARHALEGAAAASALAAFVYAALAGFAVPTQRALIMVLAALAIVLSRRVTGLFNGLAAALLVVLAHDPFATLTASFWLSFAAVALLLLLAGRSVLPRASPAVTRATLCKVGILAKLQWSITLGLAPLVAAFFGELSLTAPLVNFVAIPFFSLLLVPLALAAAASTALPLGDGLVALAALLADAFWSVLHDVSAWPWSAVAVPQTRAWVVLCGACAAVLALPAHPLPARRLVWLALVPMLVARAPRPPAGEARLLVLDIGHGLAALVETAEHSLLYDAGPVSRSGFDTGSEIVVPALAARRIAHLDVLMISHADTDHAGGVAAVLDAYPAARVLKGPDVAVPGEPCTAGQQWTWNDVRFEVLHPGAAIADRGNDSSCVLKVVTRRGSILLPGDVEARGERALVGGAALAADVVVVPHHGSATSSSSAFVGAVQPRLAVVSAAHDNRWGFPRPEVRRRWELVGADVLVTGDRGAISIDVGKTKLQVRAERTTRKRYWHTVSPPLPGESGTGAL